MTTEDLWGISEVAAYLGVRSSSVRGYKARGRMPKPMMVVSRVPLWRPEVIRAWAASWPARPDARSGG